MVLRSQTDSGFGVRPFSIRMAASILSEGMPLNSLSSVLLLLLAPSIAVVVGGLIAAFRAPSRPMQSLLQHLAAGVVFAAAANEVLPEITHAQTTPLDVIIGFAIGVASMLLLRHLTETSGSPRPGQVEQPIRLIATTWLDLLVDGLLVGVGYAAGAQVGLLLTIALTIEILFLGLATAATLTEARATRARVIGTTASFIIPITIGGVIGATLLSDLSGDALAVVLSFGAAALLYLVTEELLVEAHEVPETPWATGSFFLGFVFLFVVELLA